MSKKIVKKIVKTVSKKVPVIEDIENEDEIVVTKKKPIIEDIAEDDNDVETAEIEEEEEVETEEETRDYDMEEVCLYYKKLSALFESDTSVVIENNFESTGKNDNPEIIITTTDSRKAAALNKMFGESVKFGKKKVHISINPIEFETNAEIVEAAFKGNLIFKRIFEKNGKTFAMFSRDIIQFEDASLDDNGGFYSCLAADLADEIVPMDDVSYITAVAVKPITATVSTTNTENN